MAVYKSDKLRIEDALPAALMICAFKLSDRDIPQEQSPFANLYPALNRVVASEINSKKLAKRLQTVIDACISYFYKNKFMTNKMFITITRWGMALYRKRAVDVQRGSEYYQIWKDCYLTVRNDGINYVEGYQKLYDSALGHVTRLHKLITKHGYYI